MAALRRFAAFAVTVLAACAQQSASDRVAQTEIGALAPLERQYAGVVTGFDVRTPDTLTVAIDLQRYIDMDDDAVSALQRDALARWRTAWLASHPHQNAMLRVRLIDFIGRTVVVKSERAR